MSPASVIQFSESTRFNDPSRIAGDECTKPSTYTASKSWESSPAAVSAHAHEIADAVARELASCFLPAFKRFKLQICLRSFEQHTGTKHPIFVFVYHHSRCRGALEHFKLFLMLIPVVHYILSPYS